MPQTLLDTDAFTNTDGTELPSHNANWVKSVAAQGNNAVITNGLGCPSGAVNSINHRTGQTWTNDQWAELTIDSGAGVGLLFFVTVRQQTDDTWSGYGGGTDLSVNSNYRIVRFDSGSRTTIATTSVAIAGNDVVNLEIVGTTLTLTVNGTPLTTSPATVTDATYATGNPGLAMYSGSFNKFADSWRAGSITSATAPSPMFRGS